MSAATLTPVIERTLVAANRGRYARYASGLAHRIERANGTPVADTVARYLRDMGIRARVDDPSVRQVIDAINDHLNPTPDFNTVDDGSVSDGGNQVACDVIRAFLQDGSKHLEREGVGGFDSDEIDALLQFAGLMPTPEVLTPDALLAAAVKDKDLRTRVAAFAVEHGFEI